MSRTIILFMLVAAAVSAQSPAAFEVASVRPSPPAAPDSVSAGLHMDGQQAHIAAFSLRDYIAMAYKVRAPQISGPDWITETRFDVNATLPAGSKTNQIPEMLKGLLAERFGLKFHREQKEFSVYALRRGSRVLILKPSVAPTDDGTVSVSGTGSGAGVSVNLGGGASYSFAGNKFEGKKLTLPDLTETLESFMDRPVVNQTGLEGHYDVTLEITPDDYRVMMIRAAIANGIVLPPQALRFLDGATTPSVFDAIEKLGLHLEPSRVSLDIIILDQVSKTPTEN